MPVSKTLMRLAKKRSKRTGDTVEESLAYIHGKRLVKHRVKRDRAASGRVKWCFACSAYADGCSC
jgi:hypothetical protein